MESSLLSKGGPIEEGNKSSPVTRIRKSCFLYIWPGSSSVRQVVAHVHLVRNRLRRIWFLHRRIRFLLSDAYTDADQHSNLVCINKSVLRPADFTVLVVGDINTKSCGTPD